MSLLAAVQGRVNVFAGCCAGRVNVFTGCCAGES